MKVLIPVILLTIFLAIVVIGASRWSKKHSIEQNRKVNLSDRSPYTQLEREWLNIYGLDPGTDEARKAIETRREWLDDT